MSGPGRASEIAIGFLSFDNIVPAGTAPGVDAFDISDLTGSSYGPFAGSPFASDSLTLDNAVLTLYDGATSTVFDLGDIVPGLSTSGVEVSTSDTFTSATFTADLSSGSFTVFDGSASSTFDAGLSISATLLPSSPPDLTAGTDFVVIYVESAVPGVVPEPRNSGLLLAAVMIAFLFFRTIRPASGRIAGGSDV